MSWSAEPPNPSTAILFCAANSAFFSASLASRCLRLRSFLLSTTLPFFMVAAVAPEASAALSLFSPSLLLLSSPFASPPSPAAASAAAFASFSPPSATSSPDDSSPSSSSISSSSASPPSPSPFFGLPRFTFMRASISSKVMVFGAAFLAAAAAAAPALDSENCAFAKSCMNASRASTSSSVGFFGAVPPCSGAAEPAAPPEAAELEGAVAPPAAPAALEAPPEAAAIAAAAAAAAAPTGSAMMGASTMDFPSTGALLPRTLPRPPLLLPLALLLACS
mmetsp:Transcript_8804/g.19543  ORF Transcript_8804/g.19543 Transcript_8804/m.19543 type:complete len:278 (-) Transcript_8804:260-1093(-)